MRKLRPVFWTTLLAFTATLAFASTASAADLEGALQGLEWGMSKDKVMEKLEEKVWEEYEQEVADESNMRKKDAKRKRAKKRVERIKDSFKEFTGKRTGLEVSVVGNEFVPGNGESVIVMREDKAVRYFFFLNDQLYKLAVAYDSSYIKGVPFGSFVDAVADKYGKPSANYNDQDGFFIQAEWKKGGSKLRVEDLRDTYNTFLMAYTDVALESQVAEKHEAHRTANVTEPDVSDDINALADDGDWKSERSAADSIVGDTEVDLKAGLPEEDLQAMRDEEIAKKTDDKAGTSKKKKKRKAKRRGKSKFKDKDIKKKKEKECLIIY